MTIIYEQENQRSAAYDGTALIGQCNYTLNAGTWSIEHTEVDKPMVDKVLLSNWSIA